MPVVVLELPGRMRVADHDVIGADRDISATERAAIELAGNGADQHHLFPLLPGADEALAAVRKSLETRHGRRF
jgi:hypothetical protein